jgi:hypothetical protein
VSKRPKNLHRPFTNSAQLLALILTVFAFAAAANCQESAVDLKSPVCKTISLPYLLGEIALSAGDGDVIQKIMPCLLKLWAAQIPNSGADNVQISNSFLFVMAENPQEFFSAMATQPEIFSEWLNDLPKLSFVARGSEPCRLVQKRSELVHQLQKIHITGDQEHALRKNVIAKLSQISSGKCE